MYSTQDLRHVMEQKVPEFQQEVAAFRKEYGDKKIGEITVNMVSYNHK